MMKLKNKRFLNIHLLNEYKKKLSSKLTKAKIDKLTVHAYCIVLYFIYVLLNFVYISGKLSAHFSWVFKTLEILFQ